MRDTEATPSDTPAGVLTNHALLVVWGHFAQRIGLVKRMTEIPIDQRTRDHTPQT